MAVTLRVVRPNGTALGYLPEHSGLQIQREHNGVGNIAFGYLAKGHLADTLDNDDAFLYVIDGGVERSDVYLLEDDGDDPTDEAGEARQIAVTGRGVRALLERAIVYPRTHRAGESVTGHEPKFMFVEPAADDGSQEEPAWPTPGRIMQVLINRAQARGAIPQITTDFDADRDSAGRIWPEDYTVTYDAGVTLDAALQTMLDMGWCDAQMKGLTLQLFVPDTQLNTDRPNTILRRGREVLSGPRARTRRTARSHLLAVGDEGVAVEARDEEARARYGRREGFLGQGGMTIPGVLQRVADKTLALTNKAAEGFTVELDLSAGGPRPGIDYDLGDRIRYDQRRLNEREYEPMRVRTISDTWDDNGNRQVSLELNDLFVERSIRLARRIEGIVNGSSGTGRPVKDPDPGKDKIAPRPPNTINFVSGTITKESGDVVAVATVSWPMVTQNDDGSVMDDFGTYTAQMGFPSRAGNVNDWTGGVQVGEECVAYFQDLPPGEDIKFRVRTLDSNGNKSDWRESDLFRLARDVQPPPAPGAPAVEALLSGIRVGWDGLGRFGEAMPVDFDHCRVHMSTDGAGFAVSDQTKTATLRTRGYVTIAPLDNKTTYYFRLQTVDRKGNESVPSPTVSAKPRQVVSDELADRIIRLGALADVERASVTTTWLSTFEATDPRWVRRTGTGTLSVAATATAAVGGYVGQVTGGTSLFEWSDNIPYDPEQMYRVQARVRVANVVEGSVSFGLAGYAADGITRVSAANTTTGEDHLATARNRTMTTVNQWVTFTGFFRGRAEGASLPDEAHQPSAPRQIAASAKYVRPVIAINGAATTVWHVDQFTVELLELSPNIIGTAQIADATIVNAKIADLAVDDAKIGTLSVTKLTSGVMNADLVVGREIRTSTGTTGQRVVIDPTGIFAKSGAEVTTFKLGSDGNFYCRGELQTGLDNGQHISIKSSHETYLGQQLPATPSIRLFTGNNNEVEPAFIMNEWRSVGGAVAMRPVLELRAGKRLGGPTAGIKIIGGGQSSDNTPTRVDIDTNEFVLKADTIGQSPNLFVRNESEGNNTQAPITVGAAGGPRLLISPSTVEAADGNGNAAVMHLARNATGTQGGVTFADRLVARANPDNGAQGQITTSEGGNPIAIVFGTNSLSVTSRGGGTQQPIRCQSVILPGRTLEGVNQRSAPAPVPPGQAADEIAAMSVVTGRGGEGRDLIGVSDAMTTNDDEGGILLDAVLATSVAAQKAMLDRIADLEARLAALETP